MPPHPPSRHACFYACFCTLLSSCYHPATILFPNLTKFFSFFSACILQALVHNPNMIEKYTHIVLDEVHERSTDADFAMLVVRTLVANAPHVKIIVMSATMQGSLFVSYFEEIFDYDQVASPYFVGAKRYPVETYFIDNLDTLAEKKRDYWTIAQNEATMKLQVLVNTRPIEKLKSALSATPLVTPFAQKVCISHFPSYHHPHPHTLPPPHTLSSPDSVPLVYSPVARFPAELISATRTHPLPSPITPLNPSTTPTPGRGCAVTSSAHPSARSPLPSRY